MTPSPTIGARLAEAIAERGFAFAPADDVRALLGEIGSLSDWPRLAASWGDLALDTYLAARGRQRRRRHAVFAVAADGAITRAPHQPHYQSLDYNPLQGGIERWFEPIADEIGDGASLRTVLECCRRLFGALAPEVRAWRVEVHQFRIEASAGAAGEPTPEGVHRDGVDFVLVLLIARVNIASGTTTVHDPAGQLLGEFTLTTPFDAALVDDSRVYHGVTPVEALDPTAPAYRDVLVVTFRRA